MIIIYTTEAITWILYVQSQIHNESFTFLVITLFYLEHLQEFPKPTPNLFFWQDWKKPHYYYLYAIVAYQLHWLNHYYIGPE